MKKSVVIISLFMLFIIIVLSGCNNSNINNNFVQYRGEMDIKLSYPNTWQVIVDEENNKEVYVSTDASRTMFNLASFETDLTLEELVDELKKELEENMTVVGDINTQIVKLNGKKAYKVDYILEINEATNEGIRKGTNETKLANYKFIQVSFIDNGIAYSLTITTPERNYNRTKSTIDEIIKSFGK